MEVGVSPVLYGGPKEFSREFEELIQTVDQNIDFLKSLPQEWIVNAASYALQIASYSIKHPGFEEEREWRIIHRPYEYGAAAVTNFNMAISGIPQTIYELPFHNPERGPLFSIPQLDLNDILLGIMIGPCAYPETVARALRDEMAAAGIKAADERIIASNIPLRQQW